MSECIVAAGEHEARCRLVSAKVTGAVADEGVETCHLHCTNDAPNRTEPSLFLQAVLAVSYARLSPKLVVFEIQLMRDEED
jgi:hypothetical protein